jgi:hypothetical protein
MGTMQDLIRSHRLIRNFNDLTGLRFGNIYPTDVDGFLEIRNKLFVFIETKFGDSPIPAGQATALNNLADAIHNPDKQKFAYVLLVSHESNGDIDVANGWVTMYRANGKWIDVADLGYTTYDFVYNLIDLHIGHDNI